MIPVDAQQLGDWWLNSEQWLTFASVQSADGIELPWDTEGARYRYVWMEAYVDGDYIQHYLLDVRTGLEGDAGEGSGETRQYVAVSILGEKGPRVELFGDVAQPDWESHQHRTRFADGLHRFTGFILESEDEYYGAKA